MNAARSFVLAALMSALPSVAVLAGPVSNSTSVSPSAMEMEQRVIAYKSERTPTNTNQTPELARYISGQLIAAGFSKKDVEIVPFKEPGNTTASLIVHYRGSTTAKPIVILGHMDVVFAKPSDWEDHAPFRLVKKDGYYYARGVADMKTDDVSVLQAFINLKKRSFVPKREMILVLTGDEETGMKNAQALAPRFKDAAYVLVPHCCTGVYDKDFKPVMNLLIVAQKLLVDFELKATGPGGHSSDPMPDKNPLRKVASAITNISNYQFPVMHADYQTSMFMARGKHESGDVAKAMGEFAKDPTNSSAIKVLSSHPSTVGLIRTTCVPTVINGGDAHNQIPTLVTADVNCRIFPGQTSAEVLEQLKRVINDPSVSITLVQSDRSVARATKVPADVRTAIVDALHQRFPTVDVVDGMVTPMADSFYFTAQGLDTLRFDPMYSIPGETHAHGDNEKIRTTEFPASLEFWDNLLPVISMQ